MQGGGQEARDSVGAGRERGGVQSVERAFGILHAIANQPGGIGLAELAKAVGLHTSTAFHIVRTLVDVGAVRQGPGSRRYHLGRTVFTLAAAATNEVDLVAVATPILEALAQETGESCHLALPSGQDVMLAARVAGTGSFRLVERTGSIRPAHCTSIGKVLLAALSPEHFEGYLAGSRLQAWTAQTITDPDLLRREILRVRQAGVAYDDAEFDPEVRCLAAPVSDYTGRVIGALGLSGPIWRMKLPRLEDLALQVRRAAAELSAELGQHPREPVDAA